MHGIAFFNVINVYGFFLKTCVDVLPACVYVLGGGGGVGAEDGDALGLEFYR